MRCVVTGYPTPDIKWEKEDGAKVAQEYNVDTLWQKIQHGNMCEIQKEDVQPEDAGEYFCIASNEHGTVHSAGYLSIGGKFGL